MKLNVLKKGQLIQEIDFGKDVLLQDYTETIFLIGRSRDCHIVLDDKKISREHVKIIHKNGKWFVEKVNPENLCKINGDEFEVYELSIGDVLSIDVFKIEVTSITEETIAIKNAENVSIKDVEVPSNQHNNQEEDQQKGKKVKKHPDLASEKEIIDTDVNKEDGDVEFLDEPEDNLLDNLGTQNGIGVSSEALEALDQAASEDVLRYENPPDEFSNEQEHYSLDNLENVENQDDEATRVIKSFASVYLNLSGDSAPYDRYVVDNEKTYIGRDSTKCQIVLNESGVSAVHAVVTKNNLLLMVEDLNSSNGTLYKGNRINKVMLKHNDEFVIGSVAFTVKISSEFLEGESATLMAVDENQTIDVEEVVEVEAEDGEHLDALGDMVQNGPVEKSILKRIWKDEQQRKKLIYGVVIVIGAWVLFGSDEETPSTPEKHQSKGKGKIAKIGVTNASQKKLSEEQRRALSALYEIGKAHYEGGRYREALSELQKVAVVDPNFNSSLQSLIALSKEGLSKIEEEEKKRQAELLMAEKKAKVKKLLEDAREYCKDRKVDLANMTFNEITKIEPENLEVTRLKLELDDWQKEEQRKALELATKKRDREDKIEKLKPGKTLYLQKEWFKALNKLDDFLQIKEMDDDLTMEATSMLKTSRDELSAAVAPLVGKAKSLQEGQDLKGAYEVYLQILRIEPSNAEALNQVGEIKDHLENRARKIYREAIISESLSLFQDAKEKFQEVQQVSPVDSYYYKKASEKIRDYLE